MRCQLDLVRTIGCYKQQKRLSLHVPEKLWQWWKIFSKTGVDYTYASCHYTDSFVDDVSVQDFRKVYRR
jgi:hypothetical protein